MVEIFSFILGSISSFIGYKTIKLGYKIYPYIFNKSYLKSNVNNFDKRIVVISGATDGVGKQFVNKLIENKFSLIILGRSTSKLDGIGEEFGQKIQQNQILLKKYQIDFGVKNILQQKQTIQQISSLINNSLGDSNFQKVQIGFINCCGQAHISEYNQTSLIDIDQIQKVNLNSFHIINKIFYQVQEQLSSHKFQKDLFLINVSSGVDLHPNKYSSIYSACKAFQSNIMKVMAKEIQSKSREQTKTINILNLSPLYIRTKMIRNLKQWDVAETSEIVDGAFKLLARRSEGAGCVRHEFLKEFDFVICNMFSRRVSKAMQLKIKMQNLKIKKNKKIGSKNQ